MPLFLQKAESQTAIYFQRKITYVSETQSSFQAFSVFFLPPSTSLWGVSLKGSTFSGYLIESNDTGARRFVISSDRQIIDCLIRPVNGKGHIITAKQAKCIATTGNILVPCSEHMLLLMIGEVWGKREVEKSGKVETR